MSTWITKLYGQVRNMRLETLFIILFLGFGVVFTLTVPPGWNTDEPDHTYRIYQLSTGNLLSEEVKTPSSLKAFGGEVPTNLIRLYDDIGVRAPGAVSDTTVKVSGLYQAKPEILTLSDDGQRTVTNFSGAALYSPVTYAMYVPIFWLGHVLSLPFFWIILVARLVGLVLTGVILFFAIKYIPVGKWIIFAVGLLPVVVGQAASIGADAPQIAVSILFLTLVLRLVFLPRVPRTIEYGAIAILGAVLVLIKIVYAPIVLLLLALPLVKKVCRNRKQVISVVLAILIALIPGIIWMYLVRYIDINSNPQANFDLQKTYVLQEPITYIKTLYYTFFTNQQTALSGLFGNFIWASAPLAAIYTYVASAIIVLSLLAKSGREENSIRVSRILRILLASISLVVAVFVATALYVYSTTLHQSSIVGIQARYFVPILPFILLAFYGNIVKNQVLIKLSIVIMSCFVLVGALLTIYFRLYQTLPMILQ